MDYNFGMINIHVSHRFETITNSEGSVTSLKMVMTSKPSLSLQPEIYFRTDSIISRCQPESINNPTRIRRDKSSSTTTAVTTTTEKTEKANDCSSSDLNTLTSRTDSKMEDVKMQESVVTKITQTNDVSEHIVKGMKCSVILENELIKRISSRRNMQIRLYLDDYPYAITFTESKIGRVMVLHLFSY